MRLDRVNHTPFSHRVGRYHFQMAQARLNTPVEPVFTYSLQPFYARQQEWVTELSHSLSRLYRFSAELDEAAREFDPARKNSAVNKRMAMSSHPEAATANALPEAVSATYELSVYKLATGQTNRSPWGHRDASNPVQAGHQEFTLSIGEQEKILTLYSAPSDTYGSVLRRMAAAINQSQMGVTARMETNHEQQSLVVQTTLTGAKQAFTLRDRVGNNIRALGLQQAETPAGDAEFSLNHLRQHSQTNQFTIENGQVRVSLHQVSREPIRIEIVRDTDHMLQQSKTLVHRYNRLLAFLNEHQDVLATQKLDTFQRVARAAEGRLRPFGIELLSNGELSLNESAWREAVDMDYVGFTDAMKGLTRQFREETLQLQKAPLGSYSRSHEETQSDNPYISQSWSSLHYLYTAKTGLFLDLLW
ncbi:flagellar filament capping protein FliD [Brevibacillus invocatus]|uniref:flagellar filament capping protein FliD n=1 Tax=Brevibacillus invocatus TaxID=173959 RepID=UPI00203E3515|nr:flagellar filament capping protein FliD [Brevibacillus invocatus]MCM3079498.1 flagellar filament capping protein FliD [Brevibacillus invocatus]MCM3429699.1 flagellar filament capping protein FliD [Brevibacillus invocatus]